MTIFRGCKIEPLDDGCDVLEEFLGSKQELCVCKDADYCNSSTRHLAKVFVLSLAIVSRYLLL